MQGYKMQAYKIQAYKIQAYKMQAYKIHNQVKGFRRSVGLGAQRPPRSAQRVARGSKEPFGYAKWPCSSLYYIDIDVSLNYTTAAPRHFGQVKSFRNY
jgi:hypothetical protein